MSEFCRQIWQRDKQIKKQSKECIKLPMSIPLDHLWTVIAIDPVNGCHCQLLAAFPNDMPYLRMVKGFQTRTVKQINSFFRRFSWEIFFWVCMGYLLASEWATSASNSRLFRIFLPLERSGTLTESMVFVVCYCSLLCFFVCPSFTYRKDNNNNGM